jgi:hypothetical protein
MKNKKKIDQSFIEEINANFWHDTEGLVLDQEALDIWKKNILPVPSLDCLRPPIRGHRSFECEECGHKWETPCRDHKTPSGEHCPECQEFFAHPYKSREDLTLRIDSSRNLI